MRNSWCLDKVQKWLYAYEFARQYCINVYMDWLVWRLKSVSSLSVTKYVDRWFHSIFQTDRISLLENNIKCNWPLPTIRTETVRGRRLATCWLRISQRTRPCATTCAQRSVTLVDFNKMARSHTPPSVWTISGQPFDNHWTTFGQTVDNLWATFGQPFTNRWTTVGQPLDNLWTNCGQPLSNLWTTFYQPLDNCWSTLGQPLDKLWTTFEQPLDNL